MAQHTRKTWTGIGTVTEKLDISAALTRAAENILTVRCGMMMLAALLLSQAQLPGGARPFCIAFTGALLLLGYPTLPALAGYTLGLLIRWNPVDWLNGWPLVACVMLSLAVRLGLEAKTWKIAAGAMLASLLPLPLLTARMDQALTFLMGGVAAGLFVPVWTRAFLALTRMRENMSADDRLCCLLLAAALCLGASWLEGQWIHGGQALAALTTLAVAWAGGAGMALTAGLFLGLALLAGGCGMETAALLALLGLIGGLLRGSRRMLLLIAGGTACALGGYAMGAGEIMTQTLPSLLLGGVGLLALPQKALDALKGKLREGEMEAAPSAAPLLLFSSAQAMADMARALPAAQGKAETLPVEMLACRLCSGCPQQQECWDSRCAQSLELMDGLIWACSREAGALEVEQAARMAGCIRSAEAYAMASGLLRSRQQQAREEARKIEARAWALEQLRGQARALGQMGERLSDEEETAFKARKTLLSAMPSLRGRPEALTVASLDGRLHVWLDDAATGGAGQRMEAGLTRILGEKMEWISSQQEGGKHLYVQRPRLAVEMGKAQKPIEGEEICGDSVLCQRLDAGRQLLALSDGMGSGRKAREESKAALELLYGALRAGYERQDALRTVNGLMVACRGDEMFATLDVCIVNLDSGEAVLEKLGACPTFLLRGGKCRRLGANTLPVGILEAVHPRALSARLETGDVILMVSDGITDAFGGEDAQLLRALGGLVTGEPPQPQLLAETLLRRALDRSGGEAADDMTVLAVRIAG